MMICSSCRLVTTAPRTIPSTRKSCRHRPHDQTVKRWRASASQRLVLSKGGIHMRLLSAKWLLPALALGLLMPASAQAACCYFSAKNTDILQPAQKVFITWDPTEKVETFTVQPKFEGNALDFGMVIPTPTQPKLHEMPRDFGKVFEEITRHLVQLRLRWRRNHHAKIKGVAFELGLHRERFDLFGGVPGDEHLLCGLQNIGVLGRKVAARTDRKSTRLNSSHVALSRMPSSA